MNIEVLDSLPDIDLEKYKDLEEFWDFDSQIAFSK